MLAAGNNACLFRGFGQKAIVVGGGLGELYSLEKGRFKQIRLGCKRVGETACEEAREIR